MYLIFLPDHPATPQWKSLEALLPALMNRAVFVRLLSDESFIAGEIDDRFSGETLQSPAKSLDVAIAWIDDEVYVFGHDGIADQLRRPFCSCCFRILKNSRQQRFCLKILIL